jgi:predicted DNA binding CopG/RHH family protein
MKKTNLKLNKEEREILEDYEKGEMESIKEVEKGDYVKQAQNTLKKSKSINIRISERDLQKIKAIAARKGLPYQTFISSLLHQYSTRKKNRISS